MAQTETFHHTSRPYPSLRRIETQNAALSARIDVQAHTVADLDRRLGQIDSAIEEATKRGKTNAALTAIEGQRRSAGAFKGSARASALSCLAIAASLVLPLGCELQPLKLCPRLDPRPCPYPS